jgi:hypothetical protein
MPCVRRGARIASGSAVAVAAVVAAGPALAHVPEAGFGGFLLGARVAFAVAPPLLALIGTALLLAWDWPRAFAAGWPAFAAAMAAFIGVGLLAPDTAAFMAEPLATVAAVFAAGAAAARLSKVSCAPVAALAGAGVGFYAVPDHGPFNATLATVAGTFVVANLALLAVAGAVGGILDRVRADWVAVAVRVVAAWVVAIAALLLALSATA